MSNREIATKILNGMSNEQINAFITLFSSVEDHKSTDTNNFIPTEKAAVMCEDK